MIPFTQTSYLTQTLRLFILSRRVAEYTETACYARVGLPEVTYKR